MTKTVLDTFYDDLSLLKLNQFPCGPGQWRQEKEPHYFQESNANEETLLSLQELTRCEIWTIKENWSSDIHSLRRLAIKKPSILTEKYIFEHFKTLRLVDKEINDVDEGLLKFTNLKELSLTGNELTSVNGANLPRSLTVLQLFANKLEHLNDLTKNPPKLQHIGAGHNKLTDITTYITPNIWPSLLSLDLSYNRISHVQETIDCVSLITTLRSVSFVRNPLTLAPCYYGYTLDKIPGLTILDDVSISLDDRLSFFKISTLPLQWDDAIIKITFPAISNLRPPQQNEEIDESNFTYPNQKEYSYFVRFSFISSDEQHDQLLNLLKVGGELPTPIKHRKSSVSRRGSTSAKPSPPKVTIQPDTPSASAVKCLTANDKPKVEGVPPQEIVFFNTESVPWTEEPIQYTEGITIKCSNLGGLDKYLSGSVQFTLMEKIVESHTEVAPPDESPQPPSPGPKNQKPGKDKDKKKKKEDKTAIKNKDGELLKWVQAEPQFKEVGCITVNLAPLLTETNINGVKEAHLMEPATERIGSSSSPSPQNLSTKSNQKKGRDKSAKSSKSDKAAGKKKQVSSPTNAPVENKVLTMSYDITRVAWISTSECRASINED